jgi:hypothetical protein
MEEEVPDTVFTHLMKIDEFFSGPDYLELIEKSTSGTEKSKKNAERLIEELALLDDTAMFFIEREEFTRCHQETTKLLNLLKKHVSTEYDPG